MVELWYLTKLLIPAHIIKFQVAGVRFLTNPLPTYLVCLDIFFTVLMTFVHVYKIPDFWI